MDLWDCYVCCVKIKNTSIKNHCKSKKHRYRFCGIPENPTFNDPSGKKIKCNRCYSIILKSGFEKHRGSMKCVDYTDIDTLFKHKEGNDPDIILITKEIWGATD